MEAGFLRFPSERLDLVIFLCYIYGMEKGDYKKVVAYWRKNAERDLDTMQKLFAIKKYPEALFFGHIVLEKTLKALVVVATKEQALYTHNLLKLAKLSAVSFSEKDMELFEKVNDFNIRARYPGFKLNFFKLCTKAYVSGYIKEISAFYKKYVKN